jgi:hypothetical protein
MSDNVALTPVLGPGAGLDAPGVVQGAAQVGAPQRLISDRAQAIMGEMRNLQAAMRAAADERALNPMQRSAAIARSKSKPDRLADDFRYEAARGAGLGPQFDLRQQIAASRTSVIQQLRDPSLTDEQPTGSSSATKSSSSRRRTSCARPSLAMRTSRSTPIERRKEQDAWEWAVAALNPPDRSPPSLHLP